ncbi:unnamed protein product [Amaranthus hypochondriacus]
MSSGKQSRDYLSGGSSDVKLPVTNDLTADKAPESNDVPIPAENEPVTFSIGSSVHNPIDHAWNNLVEFGSFFEKCYFCSKRIERNRDIFMYSNLQAFCSAECRNEQIHMENRMDHFKRRAAQHKFRSRKRIKSL